MTKDILRKEKIPFVQIPKSILDSRDISIGAKGMYTYLSSKPDNWKFNLSSMMKHDLHESERVIRKYIKELIDEKWVIKETVRVNGKFSHTIYHMKMNLTALQKTTHGKMKCDSSTDDSSTDDGCPTNNNKDNNNNKDKSNNKDYNMSISDVSRMNPPEETSFEESVFLRIWKKYPHKKQKSVAKAAYEKLVEKVDLEKLSDFVISYCPTTWMKDYEVGLSSVFNGIRLAGDNKYYLLWMDYLGHNVTNPSAVNKYKKGELSLQEIIKRTKKIFLVVK
jgi:hypothetical protein